LSTSPLFQPNEVVPCRAGWLAGWPSDCVWAYHFATAWKVPS